MHYSGARNGRLYMSVIFDRHVRLPIASGSVPLMTGHAVPQSS